MDTNKTTHSGTAVTSPTFSMLNSSTPIAVFTLKVREYWYDKDHQKKFRDNIFKIETLGKNAHWVKTNVKVGKRYVIDGYLRHDSVNGQEEVKIRVYNIMPDMSDEYDEGRRTGVQEALEHAIKIVDNSPSLEAAKQKLEVILQVK